MALSAGTRLGPYEIIAPLGAGGMGEVYRASDTNLKRQVAIKVLPDSLAAEPDRVARFQREAEVLATLNHPNIAQIYGVEKTGGTLALVMELVDGSTLADRIASGPIPLNEALAIAGQIVDALEAAHEQGIVHRDLKPANIKLRRDGIAKVLDFGLAKLIAPRNLSNDNATQTPTVTRGYTREGILLGTAAYMSPEQARGQIVDKRTDIWAFGCVLYEMLTGRPAFHGETLSDTIASVLQRDVDTTLLPANVSPSLRRALERCLDKDPKRRLRDIADVRCDLDQVSNAPVAESGKPVATYPASLGRWRPSSSWLTLLACFALGAATTWLGTFVLRRSTHVANIHPSRLSITAPPGVEIREGSAISPDGRHVVYVGHLSGADKLWLRPIDSLAGRELPGTDTATYPFWSPDSRSVAFFATGKLKWIDVTTNVVTVVCDVGLGRGGTWNEQGTILFNSVNDGPLLSVSASGGTPKPVTTLDASRQENSHRWPYFLPGGQQFLYFIRSPRSDVQGVYLGSLEDTQKKSRIVNSPSNAIFVAASEGRPSAITWAQNGNLMVQGFEIGRGRVDGEPIVVAQDVHFNAAARNAEISASSDGVLLYGTENVSEYQLTWLTRDGKAVATLGQPDAYETVRISPDGGRLAVWRAGNIAILEMTRAIPTPLVAGFWGGWSPDGRRVAFSTSPSGAPNIYTISILGSGERVRLTESQNSQTALDWSTDDRFLLYAEQPNQIASPTKSGLWVLPLADRKPFLFVETAYRQAHGQFSPDGQWLAYTSTESGRPEIYVQSFPAGRGKWKVSTSVGDFPRWGRDGSELLYVSGDQTLMSTPIEQTAGLIRLGDAKPLFKLTFPATNPGGLQDYPFDVANDGRILGFTPVGAPGAPQGLVLLSNWRDALPSERADR